MARGEAYFFLSKMDIPNKKSIDELPMKRVFFDAYQFFDYTMNRQWLPLNPLIVPKGKAVEKKKHRPRQRVEQGR